MLAKASVATDPKYTNKNQLTQTNFAVPDMWQARDTSPELK